MPPEQPNTSGPRRYAVTALKLAVSIALLSFLLSRIDLARLWANARQASIPWLAIALSVYLCTVLCSVWRWWLLLEAQHVSVPPRQLFNSYLVALFFNNRTRQCLLAFLHCALEFLRITDSGTERRPAATTRVGNRLAVGGVVGVIHPSRTRVSKKSRPRDGRAS